MGEPLTSEQAVQAARDALAGKVNVPEDAPVKVDHSEGAYVVVFPFPSSPGMLGPDFYAKVTVDSATGEVREILGGS